MRCCSAIFLLIKIIHLNVLFSFFEVSQTFKKTFFLSLSVFLMQGDTEYEFVMSEFLRINGIYWGLTAMDLMRGMDKMERSQVGLN